MEEYFLVAGIEPQGPIKMHESLGVSSHPALSDSRVVVEHVHEIRAEREPLRVDPDRLVVAPLIDEGDAQVVVEDGVLLRHAERVLIQRDRVLPDRDLPRCEKRQRPQRSAREHGGGGQKSSATLDHTAQAPHHRDEEPDQRYVRVAVRVGLSADLHDPDDWDESAQVPEPADDRMWPAPT